MITFLYEASDANGQIKKGVISADNARSARVLLRNQGLIPIALHSQHEKRIKESKKRAKSNIKISATNLVLITRQFSVLINSGLTIEEALKAISKQAESTQVKSVVSGVLGYVMEGQSLTQALGYYPKVFSELFTASIAAGEKTGRLNMVVERLADYIEARQTISQNFSGALIYPVFLVVMSIAIVTGLIVYIVPQMVDTYEQVNAQLPTLTRGLISLSEFLQAYGLVILGLMIGLVMLAKVIFSRPGPKLWLHKRFLVIPGLRQLIRSLNSARMSRTLAIMVSSGVPLIPALRSSADVLTNKHMRQCLLNVASDVSEGAKLSKALERTNSFPPLLVQMVASGESSGRLDVMLEKSADVTERELKSRIDVAISLFEPIMMVFMGVIILLIVLAILLPIINLNQVLI